MCVNNAFTTNQGWQGTSGHTVEINLWSVKNAEEHTNADQHWIPTKGHTLKQTLFWRWNIHDCDDNKNLCSTYSLGKYCFIHINQPTWQVQCYFPVITDTIRMKSETETFLLTNIHWEWVAETELQREGPERRNRKRQWELQMILKLLGDTVVVAVGLS